MKKKVVAVLIVLLGGLFVSKTVLAAWTQPKGHAYNQLTYSYYISKNKFTTVRKDENNLVKDIGKVGIHRIKQAKFTARSVTYYGEYGIIDSLTVFTSIPYKEIRSEDNIKWSGERGPSGIGDIDFGLRYKLSNNLFGSGILMSVQGAVKIPEAYEYGNPLEDLSLGEGQYDATLSLLFGRGLGKGYVVINAGYKYRFENEDSYYFKNLTSPREHTVSFKPSDQIKVFITGGYTILPKLSLRGSIDWAKSIGNASVSQELVKINNTAYTGLEGHRDHVLVRDTLSLEQDVLNLGIALAYNITPKIQTVLSYNIDVSGIGWFRTKDAGQGATYSLALVYMY